MAWYSGDVKVGDLSLHYTRTGGNKPPVVLAHGYSDNGLCWTPVAKALEGDYDLVMVDSRGHGLTRAPKEPFGYAERGDDLARVIRALDLDRPVVMGHSMGAATVAFCAAQHGDLVRGAILEDPPWYASMPEGAEPEDDLEKDMAVARAMQDKGKVGLIAQCREESPTWPEDELDVWAESKLEFQVEMLPYYRQDRENWREIAARIACPSLLIVGDTTEGALVSLDIAAEALQLVQDLDLVQVQGVGHNVRREGRPQYVEAVRNFLRKAYVES